MKKLITVCLALCLMGCQDIMLEPGHGPDEEICTDGYDNDGDGLADCDDPDCGCIDADGDGHFRKPEGDDCNDSRADIHPGATEVCDDLIDQNCDGRDLECECDDADGDGYCSEDDGGDDCDDSRASVHPGANEICDNGRDDDCDGDVDSEDSECECVDADGDGHCAIGSGDGDDCLDTDASVHPGATEVCEDGIDQDCDTRDLECGHEDCDDHADNDGDTLIDCVDPDCNGDPACETDPEDCDDHVDNDGDTLIDCVDPDCDGDPDCDVECESGDYRDCGPASDLGVCQFGREYCESGDWSGDCEGAVFPSSEVCSSGLDEDCDGSTDMSDPDCSEPGDLYTFRIHARLSTSDRTTLFVATGTIWPAGLGTTGVYYSDSTGLSDTAGHHCRYTDGRSEFTCELRLPYSADFTNINFFYSLVSDGSMWGCRWDSGVHTDILSPILEWDITYPDGHVVSKSTLGSDHGRNYGSNGCDWRSDFD